jgi:hypothetical protein
MIEKFLDEYELKARIVPGVIIAIPLLADIAYAASTVRNWPGFAAVGICGAAIAYGLGYLVRERGRAIEPKLWLGWNGPPSVRLLRHRDRTLGPELKGSVYAALTKKLSVTLMTIAEEDANPRRADEAISDAFRRVRAFLRASDPSGLWFKNNIEYGFSRNLLGSRAIWLSSSLGGIGFAVLYALKTGRSIMNAASLIGFLSLACATYIGWVVLPRITKLIADRYGELAWLAFLQSSSNNLTSQPDAPTKRT